MLAFSHVITLMLFVLVGAVGMATMQDALAPMMRRLRHLVSGRRRMATALHDQGMMRFR